MATIAIRLTRTQKERLERARDAEQPGTPLSTFCRSLMLSKIDGTPEQRAGNVMRKLRDMLFDDTALSAWGLKRIDNGERERRAEG